MEGEGVNGLRRWTGSREREGDVDRRGRGFEGRGLGSWDALVGGSRFLDRRGEPEPESGEY